ncbi:MAG: efflux RND transporter periplasmic adaptor subunit [Opitutaceae bacterium]|jgi:Cu(I)/Ag(I) efflux system membrane fusion protein
MNAKHIPFLVLIAALAGGIGYYAAKVGRVIPNAPGAAATTDTARKIKFYQSPMHPWIKSDKPGKCTICGMTLAPVYEGEAGIATNSDLITLSASSATAVGVQTAKVVSGPLVRTLRVTGVIDDEETRHRYLASYTDARITKLFVHTTGVEVTAGQPLAVLYSPDLLTARQEFNALATTTPNSPLVAAAREKLLRLGLLDTQIDALATAKDVSRDTEILAPLTGTVVERSQTAYEGGYVKAGEMIFAIGDFKKMWFMFDAYESDFPALKSATRVDVTVPSLPGEVFTAPVAFIDPNLDPATRTAKVRVILDNADRHLLHRQTAYGRVVSQSPEVLLVPRAAVLFTQKEPVVYLDVGGHAYEPRHIKIGRAGDDAYEVLSGLEAGDEVVTQGALLIDGQAQISRPQGGMTNAQ